MNLYYSIINALLLLSAVIFLKHHWYRFSYFLQMFQQHGYKTNEFLHWALRNFYSRVIIPEHYLFLIVLFSLLLLMSGQLTPTAVTVILALYAFFWFGSTRRFKPEKEKKPLIFTPRMTRLAVTLAVLTILSIFIITDLSFTGRLLNSSLVIGNNVSGMMIADPYFLHFGLLLVDMAIPLFLFISAWIMKPVENLVHTRFKRRARRKLSLMPDLKVVAITGSYGKTSTKFIINSLLEERFTVCMAPGSYNTPMGICKVINNDLDARHQILVLEMGARYEGNIAELCGIVRPDVAVITNVGKAHLETFGSEEAIAREKATLARELKAGGTLILNADDERVASMAGLNEDARVFTAGTHGGSIRASDIFYNEKGTQFTLQWGNGAGDDRYQRIEMQLLGVHNVQNFLLAAAVAHHFGIRSATIGLAARRIRPVEHRLELKRRDGLTIIDDAFNSNPVGAVNAVDILSTFTTGRRVIITPGMIELGELQEEENKKFGRRIAEAELDLVILVGEQQTGPILQGIRELEEFNGDVRVVNTLFEANEIIGEYARQGDVILYENDLPDTYNE